jgi:hypothetical protein
MNGTDCSVPLDDPELELAVQMLKAWQPERHEHDLRTLVTIRPTCARNMTALAKRGPAQPTPSLPGGCGYNAAGQVVPLPSNGDGEIDGWRHRV